MGITYPRNFCLVPISTAPDTVSFLSQGGLPRGMMCKLGRTYAPPSQARPGAGARLAPLVLVLCPSPWPPGRGLAPGHGSKDIFTAIITQYQRNRTAACNRGPLPCMSRARQNHPISKHLRYQSTKLRYWYMILMPISKILRYRSSQISKQNIRY